MSKKDEKPQWVNAGDWFVYGIAFCAFLVLFVHWVNPNADVGADYHYQKGFEAGQKNSTINPRGFTPDEIFRAIDSLYLADCGDSFLCYAQMKANLAIQNKTDTLMLNSDGTWSASWRNKN